MHGQYQLLNIAGQIVFQSFSDDASLTTRGKIIREVENYWLIKLDISFGGHREILIPKRIIVK